MKAKRSTYNYSLPITVKKSCKCFGSLCKLGRWASPVLRTVASGLGGVRGASSNPWGGGWVAPLYSKAPLLSLAANQLVTMQDLKQGLGPSGAAGMQRSASNKYKLKVGARSPGGGQTAASTAEPARARLPGRRLSAPGPPPPEPPRASERLFSPPALAQACLPHLAAGTS